MRSAWVKPGTTEIEERIHNPMVRIDNDLAVVWAPFDFLVDGKIGITVEQTFSIWSVSTEDG